MVEQKTYGIWLGDNWLMDYNCTIFSTHSLAMAREFQRQRRRLNGDLASFRAGEIMSFEERDEQTCDGDRR